MTDALTPDALGDRLAASAVTPEARRVLFDRLAHRARNGRGITRTDAERVLRRAGLPVVAAGPILREWVDAGDVETEEVEVVQTAFFYRLRLPA